MKLAFWRKPDEPDYEPSKSQKRHYHAVTKNRILSGWQTAPVPVNQIIKEQLTTLRARSREQLRNNDYVRQYVRTLQNNVVGFTGVLIQSQVLRADNPKMPDVAANKAIEAAYADAGRAVDLSGRLSRNDALRTLLSSLVTDGEYIAIQHPGKDYGKYGYQIEPIDPELLDVSKTETLSNGRQVRMGIEYDARSRPVNYWFKTGYNTREYRIVPAARVLHIFYPEFVGQERGLPWLSTTLFTLKQLDAYDEAAITAARIGASKMGFFKSNNGGEYKGEELNTAKDDGSTITEAEAGVFENIGDLDFQEFNPNYPHEQFPHFKKAGLRRVASGLGAQYETIANDREGVNYTSIRHGTLEDRENWKIIQEFLINSFIRPDREAWLQSALVSRSIKIGTMPLSRTYEDYLPCRYQPRRWPWVDPAKDMKAYETEYGLNAISISQIIREKGRDPDEVFTEIAEENAKMLALGITSEDVVAEM